ncbi:fumarylacetoacetate hydrolase family protein [Caldovatus aquaticus]|uniref:Fumarylacetoacetate hydrolase family protein n=1 Tax=Caldovatus aquaticus TaxID=2865671 RepID=A0ABS7EZH2_9PROT|nr:fumarylacetoacetate hydrolase family protein [Caldovatus aquaticus]MBW8268755.1 fumarylacetoacetate hydrolase family protein [Caldovatus aquaticus]
MRLVTFRDPQGEVRVGALDAQGLVRDITVVDAALPREMRAVIAAGPAALARVAARLAIAPVVAGARLLAPIPRPAKNIFCVGKNYREHAKEFAGSGFDATAKEVVPEAPVVFSKPPTAVIGPGEPIPSHLDPTASVDYEGELAVVIGAGGRGIRRAEAMRHVFGYTIVNDVTARTLQHRHRQWLIGKGLDGFCPMGPAILTADEVPEVGALHLRTWVNGELRQDARLADLIFDIPALIETISAGITLEPGDIIATGTPAGVGIGFQPPRFLRAGDVVRIEISGIGVLENPVE